MPKLRLPLFLTRLSIFYFLLPWQIARFKDPEFSGRIADKYYHVSSLPDTAGLAIGVFWMLLLLAFVTGFKKRISYGLAFLLHVIGIVLALPYYIYGLANFNQLFVAAIPAAAAMGLLYVLRNEDTLFSLK